VVDPGSARTESPEDAAVASERRRALAAAVASLDDRDRVVIALRWFAELSEAEMAVALGVRPGTVKSRLARAMSRLRDVLASEEVTA
jgi:RNA polymerase sigma-70 factor (ECF subfamily)